MKRICDEKDMGWDGMRRTGKRMNRGGDHTGTTQVNILESRDGVGMGLDERRKVVMILL
jgi:hypothetical protein